MKIRKKLVLVILVFIIIISAGCSKMGSSAQLDRDKDKEFDKGSEISFSVLSDQQIQDLAKVSKVWGGVKYYHPKSILGDINMDYELFRVIPSVLEENADVNQVLYDWVKSFGEINNATQEETEIDQDLVHLQPSTEWTKDQNYLGDKLSEYMSNMVKTKDINREHGYTSFKSDDVYANMDNEKPYSSMNPEDTGYRLLGLFRYWNIIEYYYPYKDIIDEDWDSVLKEFIPKFTKGRDHQSYLLTIGELTTRIHDTHASVIDSDGNDVSNYFGSYWLPASYVEIDNQIVINNAIDGSGLKNGDVLVSIDDKDIELIIEERRKYKSQSREDIAISPYLDIFRSPDRDTKVSLIRDGDLLNVEVKTELQQVLGTVTNETQKYEKENIYYINVGRLEEDEINKIMKESRDTEGIILDMRNYPSSFIPYDLAEHLIPTKTTFVKPLVANPLLPGQFYYLDDLVSGQSDENSESVYQGKIVIIMNEQTISQGEFTIMSIRNAANAIVLGRDSAATDGDVLSFTLPGNIETTMTGVGIFDANGNQTQRIGLKPDIDINPTIERIKENKDEYLEKAIQVIKGL